jgi:hypothetical protein
VQKVKLNLAGKNSKTVQEYHTLEVDIKRLGKGYDQDYQKTLGELMRHEGEVLNELKNYETERQQDLELTVLNLIFNNIEYHGRAVERLSGIMNQFPEAEDGIQSTMKVKVFLTKIYKMTNRFMQAKPQK